MTMTRENTKMTKNIRWMLVFYDMGVYAIAALLLLAFYAGDDKLSGKGIFEQAAISIVCIFAARIIGNIYGQVWRAEYSAISDYYLQILRDFWHIYVWRVFCPFSTLHLEDFCLW